MERILGSRTGKYKKNEWHADVYVRKGSEWQDNEVMLM